MYERANIDHPPQRRSRIQNYQVVHSWPSVNGRINQRTARATLLKTSYHFSQCGIDNLQTRDPWYRVNYFYTIVLNVRFRLPRCPKVLDNADVLAFAL